MRSLSSFIIIAASALALGGCYKNMPLNIDKDKLFAEIEKDGPQVEGVEGTLLTNARKATRQGEHQKASQLYQRLLGIDGKKLEYRLGLADSLRRLGRAESAESLYQTILQKQPENLRAREGKALAKLQMGEFDRAGAVLSKIQREHPARWRTLNALGILLVERGKPEDALAYFRRAASHSDNSAAIYNNIGMVHAIVKEYEKAIAALEQGVAVAEPGSKHRQHVEMNMALVYGLSGQTVKAETILEKHLPEAAVANNLGLYAYLANDENLAKSYLNSALSKSAHHYTRAWKNLENITKQGRGSAQ